MKIALTGHTSGIGKTIYEGKIAMHGFSRSNGYNILCANDRHRILNTNFDILINNACSSLGQTLLLLDFLTCIKILTR